MTTSSGRLFVVVGPTGVGKDTLLRRLVAEYPDKFQKAVSTTTRGPRPQEVDGISYHFVDRDQFESKIANKEFLEYATVHGNYYGTTVVSVNQVLQNGKDVIKDMDVQGCQIIKSNPTIAHDTKAIFIIPPGDTLDDKLAVLAGRVRGRQSGESEDVIATRLETARNELSALDDERRGIFDHLVVNDTVEEAYEAFKKAVVGSE